MLVCICNAIREQDVRSVAREGIQCAKAAYAKLGYRPRCGQCLPFAREVIQTESPVAA